MEFEEREVFQDILNNDLCHLQLSLKTADCNLRDHDGRSYLHVAMDQGANEVIIEQLLPYVDISWRDESSSNVMDLAESKDNKNLEKMILKQILEVLRIGTYEQIEKLLTSGWTVWPLPTAICSISGIKPEVSPLLFHIQSIWEKVNDVHVSIMKGRKETTNCESRLVAASADVTGLPPLQKATIFNHKYYVRYLIDNFPHVLNLQDYMGRTALHYAVVMEDGDITNMLLEAEAVDSIKDVHNNTAMTYQELPHLNTISDIQRHIRFTLHKPQQLKFFDPETLEIIEPMQNYRPTNSDSDQSLINHGDKHRIKHIKTVVTLLRLKQLHSISNRQLEVFEDTILYETVLINDVEEVRFLLEHDYNTQCRSLEGQSYLHLAVTQNVSAEIVHLLLQVIDISLCDSDGFTALDLAVTDDVSTDILFCLLDYIVKLLLSEDFMRLAELVSKGWRHWPPDKYWNCFTQKIRNFLRNMRTIEEQVDKVHNKILRGEKLLQEEIAEDTIGNWDRTGLPALIKAVICGNREAVEDILFQVPEVVNNTDNLSRSALHYAACLSDQSLFNMLLSNHAVTTIADTFGFTPTDYKLHPNLINIPNLIDHINTIINRQQIVVQDEHWASILQSYNYDNCAEPIMEESVLYKAIIENQTEQVTKLLEEDKNDLKLRDENGDTFLHVVVKQNGSVDIFNAVVGKLSDTSLLLRNEASQTAYDLIINGDYPREAADVLKDGVWKWVSEGGWNRAVEVVSCGWDAWPTNTQQTQEAGDLKEKTKKFQSEVEAFHKFIMEGNVEEVQTVLEANNEYLLTAADKTGTYPLQKTIIFQQNTILKLLLESKFKSKILNLSDNMNRTAAHYAGGCHDGGHVYSILKEAEADLTINDLSGKTPEDYLNRPEDLSVVEVQKRLRDLLYPDDELPKSANDTQHQQQTQQQEEYNTQQQQQLNNTETTETNSTTQSMVEKENQTNSKPPTPSTPPTRKPIQVYISSDIYEKKNVPPPVTVDGRYIARHLGSALTSALAEIAESRPWDPIEYLAHWLLKYRKNLDYNKSQEDMLKNIRSEEATMDEEEEQKAKRLEEERQIREEEERKRQEEEEEERKRKEEEELQKKAKEIALSQKPLLPTVTEELEEDNLYKERDERGQTELHKLAAQEGADLVALFNLGYSLADRDINNQTPRDIAEDNDIQENLDAMDSYITNMIEQEKLDALQQLLLDGYDKLDAVLSQVSTDGLPEEVTDFLKAVPEFQTKIQEALKAVESGVLREVEQCLDRKKFALAKDKYGRSPLHIAVLLENKEIVEYIVKHFPVTVKCRDNLNRTPLHYASALSEEIVEMLKSSPGVDEQAKDVKDRTPAYYSTEKTEIHQLQNQFRTSKIETENSDQTETETDQNDQQKTEPEQVTSATE